jgi:hypothetical protein
MEHKIVMVLDNDSSVVITVIFYIIICIINTFLTIRMYVYVCMYFINLHECPAWEACRKEDISPIHSMYGIEILQYQFNLCSNLSDSADSLAGNGSLGDGSTRDFRVFPHSD